MFTSPSSSKGRIGYKGSLILAAVLMTTVACSSSNDDLTFKNTLKEEILSQIKLNQTIGQIEGLETGRINQLVLSLCEEGHAKVKGTDAECRSICVTAQGAIEEALATLLVSNKAKDVTALFLTPLPTTPLRKKGDTKGLSSVPFETARQYTLDMREKTLRSLRSAGATIVAAYSSQRYKELLKNTDPGSQEQVKNWENERQHPQVQDHPIDRVIPKELVGALYIITDAEGNTFYLATQGVQAKDAGGEALWQFWLSNADSENEGTVRSRKMLTLT